MAVSMIGPKFYAWDRDGKPLAFGKLYTYEARTNNPKDTYQSEDKITANSNPVILNGEGYADIYLDGSYKMVLKDQFDAEIWSSDPVSSATGQEWVNCFSATYVSPTSFKIAGNVTDIYDVGRRVRIDSNDVTYDFSTIKSSIFAASETTITVFLPVVTVGIVTVCSSIVGVESILTGQTVNDMFGLINVAGQVDGDEVYMTGFFFLAIESNPRGGGPLTWKADLNKNLANGITIIDPSTTGGWDGTKSNLSATYYGPSGQGSGVGSGCWVRPYAGVINVHWSGAIGDLSDETVPFQAAYDIGPSLYLPLGVYGLTELTLSPNRKIFGDTIGEFGNDTGTVIKALAGGTLTSTVVEATLRTTFMLNTSAFSEQTVFENVKIINTVYEWTCIFEQNANYFNMTNCRVEGGTSASISNSHGFYFHQGFWESVFGVEFIYLSTALYFGDGHFNNAFTVSGCKFHFNNIGFKSTWDGFQQSGAINDCFFEGNLVYDIDNDRPYVESRGCYFDGSHVKVRGVHHLEIAQQRLPQANRDYDTTIGRVDMGTYVTGIPHIDREPAWNLGSERDSFVSVHALEVAGNTNNFVTREGAGVTIATNNATLRKNGKVFYAESQTGDSLFNLDKRLSALGMSMASDWTIGLAFYNNNAGYASGTDLTLADFFNGGNGVLVRLNHATPGIVDVILYNASAATVIQMPTNYVQGLNILTIGHEKATDEITLTLNGNVRTPITGAAAKLALSIAGTDWFHQAALEANGIYFVEFTAVPTFHDNANLAMRATPWKDEKFSRVVSQELVVQDKFVFPRPETATAAGNIVLDQASSMIQFIDANGVDRAITLPPEEDSNGLGFFIANTASGAFNLLIKDDSATTIITINQDEAAWVFCNGVTWRGAVGGI